MKKLLFIITILMCGFGFSQNSALFKEGNTLYNAGKYTDAINKYETILKSEKHSAELYFNLANAHYKLNNIAPSIYYYEKALQLAPEDVDIKNNAAFARNMTIDAIDVMPEVGVSKWLNNSANTFNFDAWAYIAIGGVLLFVILFLVYYFSKSTALKRVLFIGSSTVLIISVISLCFAFHKYNLDKNDVPAIVFAKESTVKDEPNLRGVETFKLHEGTKIQVLDTVDGWKEIKLTDGTTGWIRNDDIKLLKNF
ncbi:tetratricopeptide repeat protein [Lacinutrix undariae]